MFDASCMAPPERVVAGADYLGFVEQADHTHVMGWAIDQARLPGRAQVAVLAPNGPVAIAWADIPRPDVAEAGFPSACCGFDMRLPSDVQGSDPPHVVFWPDRVAIAPVEGVLLGNAPARRGGLRLGVVSSWQPGCGIADYARHVVRALSKPFDITVYARESAALDANPDRPHTSHPAGDDAGPNVRLWWQDCDAGLELLCDDIAKRDLDRLLVEHHPGVLAWQRLGRLIEHAHACGIAVFVRLHSVRGSMDAIAALRPALRLCEAILLHTDNDVAKFHAQLPGVRACMVPHGVPPTRRPGRPPHVRSQSTKNSFHVGAFGFLHRYKGVAEHLLALHLLRKWVPGLRATLLHALTDDPATADEAVRMFSLRQQLGLADIVDIDTRLLPMAEMERRLAGCDVLVFAYQDSAESASGAARAVAGLGVPLLCTPSSIFSDVLEFCHVPAGKDAYAIAGKLLALARSRAALRATLPGLAAYANQHAWPAVAAQLAEIMRSETRQDMAA
jgi:glycosyltransferase involved in cell wall biosynthesis